MSVLSAPINRGDGHQRGTWKPCHPSTEELFKATFTCSNGHSMVLKKHSVDDFGRVTPSVVCQEPGCSFHEWVVLEDWQHRRSIRDRSTLASAERLGALLMAKFCADRRGR